MADHVGRGTAGSTAVLPDSAAQRPRRHAEIDLSEARKAFFLMVGFIALIWIIQIANWVDRYGFDASYGIVPRDVLRLPDIFVAPFLHLSWSHIEANSGPLFVFGFLAAYRGVLKFLGVTLIVAVISGAAVWFFQGSGLTVGASGLIFGYFGYLIARGLIEANLIDVLISVVMGLSYYYLVTEAAPGAPGGVSWLAHLGGLVGGVACGWIFRGRRGHAAEPASPAGAALATQAAAALARIGGSGTGTESGTGSGTTGGPGRKAGGSGSAGSGSAGPGSSGPGSGGSGSGGSGSGATGGFKPGKDHPRADLHEELRKLGLE